MQKELKDSLFQQYFAQEPQTSPYRQIPLLPDKLTRNLYCQLLRSALGQAALEASCSSEDTSRESSFFHATSKHSIQILWVITLKCQSSHILQRNSLVLVEGCQACGISLSKGLNPSWQFALKSCCLNKRESRRSKMYDTKCTQPPTSTKLFGLYCCICLLDIWFLQFQQLLKKPAKNCSYNMLCSDVHSSQTQVAFLPGDTQGRMESSKFEEKIKKSFYIWMPAESYRKQGLLNASSIFCLSLSKKGKAVDLRHS